MAEQVSRIHSNTFFSFLSLAIRLLTNFLVFVGIARLYGPEAFGQFAAAHALSGIFLLLADFGFDTLLVTEIAQNQNNARQVIQSLLSMKILFAIFATALMIGVASIESVSQTTRTLMYLFSFYVLFSSLANFFFYLFRGYQEFHQETKISFVMNGLLLVTVIALSILHASLLVIALAFIGTRVVGIIIGMRTARNKLEWKELRFSIASSADFRRINVYGLYGIFGTILFTLDTVLLTILTNDLQVGLYQSVIKLASVGLLASDILVYSILPALSEYYTGDHDKWFTLAQYTHKTLVFVGTFVAFFMIVFPSDLINMVYGVHTYNAAVPILRIFGCVIFTRYCSEAGGLILTSSNRQSRRLVVVIIATVFNLLANVLIIPRFGITGAAIVSLLTNVIVGIGYLYNGRIFQRVWLLDAVRYVPIMIAVGLGVLFWDGRSLNASFSLPLSAVAMLLGIYYIGFSRLERLRLITWKREL